MTHQSNPELLNTVLQLLNEQGSGGLAEGIRLLVDEAMRQERCHALQAQPYERTDTRQGHANGFKPKTLDTRIGPIQFKGPASARRSGLLSQRVEKASGASKPSNWRWPKCMCRAFPPARSRPSSNSSAATPSAPRKSVSAAALDAELETWRNRPLGCFPYVFTDARYEKVRRGRLLDCAVLIALGIGLDGKRSILGVMWP